MFGETQRPVPSTTVVGANVTKVEVEVEGETVMDGVEHLGQYVHQMTLAKIEHLKRSGTQLPTREVQMADAREVAPADDDDRPENVLIPDEVVEDYDTELRPVDEE